MRDADGGEVMVEPLADVAELRGRIERRDGVLEAFETRAERGLLDRDDRGAVAFEEIANRFPGEAIGRHVGHVRFEGDVAMCDAAHGVCAVAAVDAAAIAHERLVNRRGVDAEPREIRPEHQRFGHLRAEFQEREQPGAGGAGGEDARVSRVEHQEVILLLARIADSGLFGHSIL